MVGVDNTVARIENAATGAKADAAKKSKSSIPTVGGMVLISNSSVAEASFPAASFATASTVKLPSNKSLDGVNVHVPLENTLAFPSI